mmetsp:Transcript_16073/g.38122  ORF Transcript_16073/g.38122 Transcript_16073/m.38122 type:complete len:488 (-) Transcript_16073:24-1487(-)
MQYLPKIFLAVALLFLGSCFVWFVADVVSNFSIFSLRTVPKESVNSTLSYFNKLLETLPTVTKTWIWKCNQTVRYSHMSTLVALSFNKMGAAWQASPVHEGQSLGQIGLVQNILYAYSQDGGLSWSKPMQIFKSLTPAWGPVLHFDSHSRRLWLFYSSSSEVASAGGDVLCRTTTQYDRPNPRWSPPKAIWRSGDAEGLPKVTANRVFAHQNGDWLLPVWQEGFQIGRRVGVSTVLIGRRTSSDGRSWTPAARLSDPMAGWLIEGTIAAPRGEGPLQQLFRSRSGRVWRAESTDGGETWTSPAPVEHLPNPNSKARAFPGAHGPLRPLTPFPPMAAAPKVAMASFADPNGRAGLLLAYNPSPSRRTPLVLAHSPDGRNWTDFAVVEDGSDGPRLRYAYPTLVVAGGTVHCSYTVYEELPPGKVMGVARVSLSVGLCRGGRASCEAEEADDAAVAASSTRPLRNRFIGLRVASLPVPVLRPPGAASGP